MMAPSVKTVVMLLASLQLTQQASLSSNFYGTKNVFEPLNNKQSFRSSFNIPSVKFKKSADYVPIKSEELKSLHNERDSTFNVRLKRQVNQDIDIDAEIISNDPEMFSYGKSMPMTTDDNEDTHKPQLEEHDSTSWNKVVDTVKSNLLGVSEGNPKKVNETSNEEEKANTSDSKTTSSLLSKSLDISMTNDASAPKTSIEGISDSTLQKSERNFTEIHTVPTIHYEVPLSEESESEENKRFTSMETSTFSHDDTHIKNNDDGYEQSHLSLKEHFSTPNPQHQDDKVETHLQNERGMKSESLSVEGKEKNPDLEDQIETNEMKYDDIETTHSQEELNKSTIVSGIESSVDSMLIIGNSTEKANGKEEIVSKGVLVDEDEAELNEYLDKDDVHVFTPVKAGNSDTSASLSQLRLPDNDDADIEEGSGDIEDNITGSHETDSIHDNIDGNSSNTSLLEEMLPQANNMDINIDSDLTTENTVQEGRGNEDESPISDPTLVATNLHDSSGTIILPAEDKNEETDTKLPISEPTENPSNVDLSQTYDPKTIVDPVNIDSLLAISKTFGGKAFGISDNYEAYNESKELEGSGQIEDTEFDKDSAEDGLLTKPGEDYEETTTDKDDDVEEKEITELPIIVKHHNDQFNQQPTISNENGNRSTPDSVSTEITTENTAESGATTGNESISIVATELPSETNPKLLGPLGELETHISGTSNMPDTENNLPVLSGINEVGIKSGKVTEETESTERTSSSSTGSFIVLGAIMATIVLLLGYSVIKSYREKQRISRTPPEDDQGTELKEIETLLSEKNGHGPANGLNVEKSRLLNVSKENDKNDLKASETYHKYPNVIEENDVRSEFNTVPKIDDPYSLSEVKVNTSNGANPENVSKQVANGTGLKNASADHKQLYEPSSPSADKASLMHGTKPESAKTKMFIDHDSIPKTPIVIVKRGSNNVEM